MAGSDEHATIDAEAHSLAEPATLRYRLQVIEGVDRGKEAIVDGAQTAKAHVGTSNTCDLVLTDRKVSRRHASFEVTPEGLRVIDLSSTNGLFLSGHRFEVVRLRGGEQIRLGDTTLLVTPAGETKARTSEDVSFGRLLGASPAMRRLYPVFEQLARTGVPVLIEGESGTGKELLAEAIHERGPRASAPFLVFDCARSTGHGAQVMLFGDADQPGVFEQANGGTVLLDEVSDLDPATQGMLLRVLERGEIVRCGEAAARKVDVRVLATTRRDLDKQVQDGQFREDLYYRLAVVRVELPPLRDRQGDVALLARHFWRRLANADEAIPRELIARCESERWPGNVRELRSAIARHLALGSMSHHAPPAKGPEAESGDFLEQLLEEDIAFPRARERLILEFERRFVERVMARHNNNISRAAAASGIARRHLYTLMARHQK